MMRPFLRPERAMVMTYRIAKLNPSLAFGVAFFLAFASATAMAGDPENGRVKARQCQACHGMDGLSKLPEAPNLRGQIETYLVKAIHDFKEGNRHNEIMNTVAAKLSEEDIENLAAYYTSLQ